MTEKDDWEKIESGKRGPYQYYDIIRNKKTGEKRKIGYDASGAYELDMHTDEIIDVIAMGGVPSEYKKARKEREK
jgi:hypothetical protein